uniref:Hypothetical chloroplast RF1 n=1 Tax=Chlamydomonas applanata TaxID=35704 RepID=A0A0S2LPT6_CHLAP|nr:hypothetical chloroplast RF1 [Chlamydomonas applanata]
MIPILSVVTSVKDYLEVVHKLIEYDTSNLNINYSELGAIITYLVISLKNAFVDFLSFSWLNNLWSLPVIIPDISSAMISEISVLDGYFHNAFNFLDTPVSYSQDQNTLISSVEKLTIGILNSLFLFLPTSTAHIITLRRFVMQGLEAGYISGLGTIAGNLLWLTSVIFGWRFFVIPWLSLDIFRYVLGFILLVKYMWDSYNERRTVLEDVSKQKIFLLNFLLALTEQTSIYPFISNISVSPEASLLESFPADSYIQFICIHGAYLLGIAVGCISLLHLTCWFWENPAFKIYMWMISSFKVSTSFYYKVLNFTFLYLTMISAISSIPYYGLDYTITNPLGYVNDDRIVQDKLVLETSFLGGKASDRNTRRNPGRHGRRERWKRRIRKYRTFDSSLYDQGIYDLFTIEDLNYGFDRFWLRRKLRNHHVKFRFFPGPWMRSFKKQLAKPRLESYTGPRIEFFRILFEQVYHPSFHAYETKKTRPLMGDAGASPGKAPLAGPDKNRMSSFNLSKKDFSIYSFSPARDTSFNSSLNTISSSGSTTNRPTRESTSSMLFSISSLGSASSSTKSQSNYVIRKNFIHENSTLRKFVRKLDNRLKVAQIGLSLSPVQGENSLQKNQTIYSKRWKNVFSKMYKRDITNNSNSMKESLNNTLLNTSLDSNIKKQRTIVNNEQILRYRSLLQKNQQNQKSTFAGSGWGAAPGYGNEVPGKAARDMNSPFGKKQFVFLHPLKFYLQQEAAFNRKLRYYTPSVYRKFSVENNAPYFRVMMRRYFYNYKPTNRWERTMKVASLRKARRKTTRIPRKLQNSQNIQSSVLESSVLTPVVSSGFALTSTQNRENAQTQLSSVELNRLQKPTYNYSVVSKRGSRYRYQIYKDVLQHWYYSPFNRLLLKMDVDSFIRRQPTSHFLTPKEENLLHLRRVLLSEHYNTLRWYTNMEHYRSMKTRLGGGTKSFSSRVYNQQFAGTFKKIRHLFAITPSQGNVVLKFDQPLYNEYPNTSANPLLNSMVIHEELLNPGPTPGVSDENNRLPQSLGGAGNSELTSSIRFSYSLLNQSQNVVRDYLIQARSGREEYIKTLLNQNNYTTLTQFIYKGQKLRGDEPTTSQRLLNNQEKQYLLTNDEMTQIDKQFNNSLKGSPFTSLGGEKAKLRNYLNDTNLMEDLYVTYLKKWKRRINDQEALKNYLTRRIDKRQKRKQKREKHLLMKLKQLSAGSAFSEGTQGNDKATRSQTTLEQSLDINNKQTLNNQIVTTGLQKSIFDGILTLKNLDSKITTSNEKSFYKKTNTVLPSSRIASRSIGLDAPRRRRSLRSYKRYDSLNTVKKEQLVKDVQLTTSQLKNIVNKYKTTGLLKQPNVTNKLQKVVGNRVSTIYKTFKTTLSSSLGLTKLTRLLKPIKRKTLTSWRKKERAFGKQKRLRKDFKVFKDNKYMLATSNQTLLDRVNLNSFNSRQKRDSLMSQTNQQSFNDIYEDNNPERSTSGFNLFIQKFKRKRSSQRHSRGRRNHGVFKKRTLSTLLKKDLKTLDSQLSSETKMILYNKINAKTNTESQALLPTLDFELRDLKQRKTKQRKQRYWKQKRSKFNQKRQKYRKRRRDSIGKIRLLSKQLKRVKNKIEIQNWWWKQFLPSIQASTDALWQIEKDKLIQQKLSELSPTDILERDRLFNLNNSLQIGNKDFKPLALPEAMRLKNQVTTQNLNMGLDSLNKQNSVFISPQGSPSEAGDSNSNFEVVNRLYENLFINSGNPELKMSPSPPRGEGPEDRNTKNGFNPFLVPNTGLPFYAGWDESLRKFVVTNRMLSRQDAGYEMSSLKTVDEGYSLSATKDNRASEQSVIPGLKPLFDTMKPSNSSDTTKGANQSLLFTQAPLEGMNAATTLYWQIPFTTYDPDQFFALGMDGFSPIGWRKFLFRHSILKSWLSSKTNSSSSDDSSSTLFRGSNEKDTRSLRDRSDSTQSVDVDPGNLVNPKGSLIVKKQNILVSSGSLDSTSNLVSSLKNQITQFNGRNVSSVFNSNKSLFKTPDGLNTSVKSTQAKLATSRRLKKRLRRVRKHPRTPVWFPSGPLLNQVLPVHYIYVFYKRARLPRDRYLKRRLLNAKTIQSNESFNTLNSSGNMSNIDFTLRKRLKPKRKYHLKRTLSSANVVIPRRFKFIGSSDELLVSRRTRPLSSTKINKSIADLVKEQKLMRTKQRNLAAKQQTPALRVKQLKRRVQRQIIRSVWRYRPRAGGFVWPGDYLKLELVKAPKLKSQLNTNNVSSLNTSNINLSSTTDNSSTLSKRKAKRKKKRALVEWQIQPKKYLYEKHNIRVLKKKLEKAQRSDKIREKVKELNFTKS